MSVSFLRYSWTAVCLILLVSLGAAFATQNDQAGNESVTTSERKSTSKIKQVLAIQRDAWNRGSIDDFMEYYWKSEDLSFSSGGTTTRGWKATKAGYKKRYATREEMGTLAFDQIEVNLLGDSASLVLGRWQLERDANSIGGNFTLVFRKIDGDWLIIHDHTSLKKKES